MDMSVKDFRKLSRDNNYYVTVTAQPLSRRLSAVTPDELARNDAKQAAYVHRKSSNVHHRAKIVAVIPLTKRHHRAKIVAVIPLTKRHDAAEFLTSHPNRDISKAEFNLIKEFTHND